MQRKELAQRSGGSCRFVLCGEELEALPRGEALRAPPDVRPERGGQLWGAASHCSALPPTAFSGRAQPRWTGAPPGVWLPPRTIPRSLAVPLGSCLDF